MFVRRLMKGVFEKLPAVWLARLDALRPSVRREAREPFNGQDGRRQIFRELLRTLPLHALVETGTFRGTTTAFLARESQLPVFTVEAVPRAFQYARFRLRGLSRVRLELGDSRRFIERLAHDASLPKVNVFFYLDAHWYQDLPLREEVELIARFWKSSVIMIDDFEVPGDAGYGFDDYGPGKRLCLGYLPPLEALGLVAFFPSIPSATESGARRGCVVLVHGDLAGRVRNIAALRPHERPRIQPQFTDLR